MILLILIKVTPKQCPGVTLTVSGSKMQSASRVYVKCEPNSFGVTSGDSGNLRATIQPVCELQAVS